MTRMYRPNQNLMPFAASKTDERTVLFGWLVSFIFVLQPNKVPPFCVAAIHYCFDLTKNDDVMI